MTSPTPAAVRLLLLGVLLLGVVEPNDGRSVRDDVRREGEVDAGAVVGAVDAALDVQDTEVAIRVERGLNPPRRHADPSSSATTSRRSTSSPAQ